jgi:hypothetical protein
MFCKVILIIGVVIAALIIGGLIFLWVLFPPLLSKEATKKDFLKNYEDIMVVTNYMLDSKYKGMVIYCTDEDKTMYVIEYGDIPIGDTMVIETIDILKQKGYQTIVKEKNNISFVRSSSLDAGSGVVYSIDGSEPQLQFLTRLEPLEEPNWYYYEEDFNEWRERNPQLFE